MPVNIGDVEARVKNAGMPDEEAEDINGPARRGRYGLPHSS